MKYNIPTVLRDLRILISEFDTCCSYFTCFCGNIFATGTGFILNSNLKMYKNFRFLRQALQISLQLSKQQLSYHENEDGIRIPTSS